jgi:hypothetical protein
MSPIKMYFIKMPHFQETIIYIINKSEYQIKKIKILFNLFI